MLAVIPFFHRRDQLDRCLAALAKSTHPITPWIHDNSVENLGFTRAINLGLRAAIARGDAYTLLINQDCYVEPDTIATLLEFMSAHPRCAIAGPMQLDPSNPDLIISAGGIAFHPQGMVRRGSRLQGHCAKSIPVVYVNGACMFVRLAAVAEFGLMDESMPLTCSDADWCLTARARGWEAWYCADARVLHEKGVTDAGSANPIGIREQIDRDNDTFRRKWLGSILAHELNRMPGQLRLAESVEQMLKSAAAHLQAGGALEAEMVYRDILLAEPDNLPALEAMGELMWTRYRNPTLAHDYFQRAAALSPDRSDLRLRYAMTLDAMHRTDQAVEQYAEAARLEKTLSKRIEEIAARLSALGREREAAIVRTKLSTFATDR